MTFDLHISKFHIYCNFLAIQSRALIFHMCIPCNEAFLFISKVLTLWPWPWPLTYISLNFLNICHNFWTIRCRAFIFNNMYIPYDGAFLFIPRLLSCVTITFDLLIWKLEKWKKNPIISQIRHLLVQNHNDCTQNNKTQKAGDHNSLNLLIEV